MKVLFTTNFPSKYRAAFFEELGKHCALTVLYERNIAAHRDSKWLEHGDGAASYQGVFLDMHPFKRSQSFGTKIVRYLQQHSFDYIVFSGYSSPSVMLAVEFCRLKHISYYFEYDGGFNEADSLPVALLKKHLLRPAAGHFITCKQLKDYLVSIGVDESKLIHYPFTSVHQRDIDTALTDAKDKGEFKRRLGISEKKMILAVGQFIPRKGFDILMKAATSFDSRIGIYFVGGTPTEEYLTMQKEYGLTNIHFVEYVAHEELRDWYHACDVFVLPTRYDIWGLVINEAMACGAPVVSTSRCVAATELIDDGISGYIVSPEQPEELAEKINAVLSDENLSRRFSANGLKTMKSYSLEKMAEAHYDYFLRDDGADPLHPDSDKEQQT